MATQGSAIEQLQQQDKLIYTTEQLTTLRGSGIEHL